jgi:ABC-type transporter Mla subunit MlaD
MLRSVESRGLAALLAAAALAGIAGCGGDDGAESGYREDANAMCAEAKHRVEALQAPSTIEDFEPFLRRLIEMSREFDHRLRALEPPTALAAQHRRLIRLSDRGDRLLEALADDFAAGRPPLKRLQRRLSELEDYGRQNNALARRMKLPDCVAPLTVPAPAPEPA